MQIYRFSKQGSLIGSSTTNGITFSSSTGLRLCTTCIHYLLHLADCALETGVLSHNWEFVIERYAGIIKSSVRTRWQVNRHMSLNGLAMEQANHLPYVCSNEALQAKHPGQPEVRLLSNPLPRKVALSSGEHTKLRQFIAREMSTDNEEISRLMSRGEKFEKHWRYRNDIHTISCADRFEDRVEKGHLRAAYYVRFLGNPPDDFVYGKVRYYLSVKLPGRRAETISIAYIEQFSIEVVNGLTVVRDMRQKSVFIQCSNIEGLIGLISKDGRYYIVDQDSAFFDLVEDGDDD